MDPTPSASRFQIVTVGEPDEHDFARAVQAGLAAKPKSLPCRFFYDTAGMRLFEEICAQPEYYLPQAERQILEEHASELAAACPPGVTLAEFGCGCGDKTALVIAALLRRRERLRYVPMDFSRSTLEECARRLLERFPNLEIAAARAEYRNGPRHLRSGVPGSKLVLWLGSNIGNLDRQEAAGFLRQVRDALGPEDRLLLGVDRRKPGAVVNPAYNDAAGATARFNLNLLARINSELGGRFDVRKFRHSAFYNEAAGRVEMYLVSGPAQRVLIERLETMVSLDAGEAIHTEDSYKYSPQEIEELVAAAGLRILQHWTDVGELFSSVLMAPATS